MRARGLAGYVASAAILLTFLTAATGLAIAAGPAADALPWGYIGSVVLFTLYQAALSTLLSLTLGGGIALALARRQFFGKGFFLALLYLAAVLPVVVAVLGIIDVYGRSGWLGSTAKALGFNWSAWLYGLPGILIAHVFFNAPLAARSGWLALGAIPGEHWRLARHLGFGPWAVFRIVDWPVLRREIPRTGALIFFLCFTSFAAVLTLGGGPGTATLEVAIYEAIRTEADFGRAGLISLIQMMICCALAWPVIRHFGTAPETTPTGLFEERPDTQHFVPRCFDTLFLAVGAWLILPPLCAILIAGLPAWRSLLEADVAHAAFTSLVIALLSATLALLLGLGLASCARRFRLTLLRPRLAESFGFLAMAILFLPAIALAAGLFVVLRPVADPSKLALPLVIFVNALAALPFVYRQIEPPLLSSGERFGRLADSLGIDGWHRLSLVDWPLLRRPAIVAFIIAMALSLGDLGVVTLFGGQDLVTLPLLVYQLKGAYQLDAAASVSLLIAASVLGLFWAGHWLSLPLKARRS